MLERSGWRTRRLDRKHAVVVIVRSSVPRPSGRMRRQRRRSSSTGLLPNELRPTGVPRFAAARATATSPSGCTACTPGGDKITASTLFLVFTSFVSGRVSSPHDNRVICARSLRAGALGDRAACAARECSSSVVQMSAQQVVQRGYWRARDRGPGHRPVITRARRAPRSATLRRVPPRRSNGPAPGPAGADRPCQRKEAHARGRSRSCWRRAPGHHLRPAPGN
jgi:hypothetical protein